jgi:hypothetical protein
MKSLTLFFLLLFSQQILAQQALEISSTGGDKMKLFKENKRVKVKTIQGEKHIGRFQIIDSQNIEIEGNIIPLSSIANIKSRSIVAGIAGTVLIVYGAFVVGVGLVYGSAFDTPTAVYISAVFGGLIVIPGIFFNEFAKNHRNQKWSYKIVD